MKKFILSMFVTLGLGLSAAFASGIKEINERVAESFKKEFQQAEHVSWQQEKSFSKATFQLNHEVMFAYYNNESGELIAVVRNILSEQLPISLFTSLKQDYANYWISDLFEMDTDGDIAYFATVENADESLILKSAADNTWTVYKKVRKN